MCPALSLFSPSRAHRPSQAEAGHRVVGTPERPSTSQLHAAVGCFSESGFLEAGGSEQQHRDEGALGGGGSGSGVNIFVVEGRQEEEAEEEKGLGAGVVAAGAGPPQDAAAFGNSFASSAAASAALASSSMVARRAEANARAVGAVAAAQAAGPLFPPFHAAFARALRVADLPPSGVAGGGGGEEEQGRELCGWASEGQGLGGDVDRGPTSGGGGGGSAEVDEWGLPRAGLGSADEGWGGDFLGMGEEDPGATLRLPTPRLDQHKHTRGDSGLFPPLL